MDSRRVSRGAKSAEKTFLIKSLCEILHIAPALALFLIMNKKSNTKNTKDTKDIQRTLRSFAPKACPNQFTCIYRSERGF
jgi:hypothetical protein